MSKAHELIQKVYYEDTDALGMVYHGSYVQFFDRGRISWLEDLGYPLEVMHQDGVLFAVRHIDIDYYYPAKMGNNLRICTAAAKIGKASLVCGQKIYLQDNKQKVICEARVKIACLDLDYKPRALPEALLAHLQKEGCCA